MDAHTASLGVAASGCVLVTYPIVQGLRSGAGLPDASRIVRPLIVVGGCALLAQVAPWIGLGLAVLVVLEMLLRTPAAGAKPVPPATRSHAPRGPSTITAHR